MRSVLIRTKIETFISDLRRLVQALEANIKTEEERANVFDRTKPDYPDAARRMNLRRDNLIATIALLEVDRAADNRITPFQSTDARLTRSLRV